MNISNWKTTAWGVGGAIAYLVISFIANKTISLQDLAVAGALVGIGANAADASTAIKAVAGEASHLAIMKNGTVKAVIPIADNIVDGIAAAHPLSPVLTDIKTGLDTINANLSQQSATDAAKK